MNLAHEIAQIDPYNTSPETMTALLAQWMEQAQSDAEQIKKDAQQITQQHIELQNKETHIAALSEELKTRNEESKRDAQKIAALTHELAWHKRLKFAAKSEAFTAQQRDLFEECCTADLEAIEAELEQLTPPAVRTKKKPTGRKPLPPELPRVEYRHEPESCSCGRCGQDLVRIGEDITEQLDVEPARFTVQRHIRPQYACRQCETMTAAPIPPAVIDGGLATPGLLSWVTIQKYLDHLPLYRIEQISARHGAPIARSTLAQWIGKIGVALQPLADRLAELLKERRVLHADETPVPQLDPGQGKTKRAYLWAYRSNDLEGGPPMVVFEFQPGRNGKHARAFLAGWQGHLMVDDYAGYKQLFEHGVTELACLAHVRRKFFDLHVANQHPIAAEALQRIGELYHLEQQVKYGSCEEREQWRAQHAQPRLQAMHEWLLQTRKTTADGGALARAIDYSLKRWPALVRYAASGLLPIDNNPVENAIRPIALGKKNWLFAGSERAGMRAAAIQTLLATAKANGIEPFAWLKETLEKLPTCLNSQIDQLLPLRH